MDALLTASRALVAVAARSLAGTEDVTLPQFRALVLLSLRSRTTVSDLAEALGVHPSTATRLCDRLVRKQLIRRAEARDDRRAIELHLTAQGHRLLEGVTARRRQDLAAIASRLSRQQLAELVAALSTFSTACDRSLDGADSFGWEMTTG